jgi:hypothetical protein
MSIVGNITAMWAELITSGEISKDFVSDLQHVASRITWQGKERENVTGRKECVLTVDYIIL